MESLNNIIQNASDHGVTMVSGQNDYLVSLLSPDVGTMYPDDTYQTTFPKSIPLSQEFQVQQINGFTSEFRIVMPAESPRVGLYVDRKGDNGLWYHEQFIQLAQDLQNPNRYAAYRTVSGYVCLQSATLPSGQYAINGSLNAVKMSYAPKIFATAGFDQLLPYKASESASILNVSVLDGICITYPYRSQAGFQAPIAVKGDSFTPTSFVTATTVERQWNNDTEPNFFPAAGNRLFRASTDPESPYYDQNMSTYLKTYQTYTVCVSMNPSVDNNVGEVHIRLRMPHIVNGVGVEYVDKEIQYVQSKAQDHLVYGCFTLQAVTQITEIEVYCTQDRPVFTRHFNVTLKQHSASLTAQTATLSVITAKGHDYNTVFRLFGQMNFEVEPGSDLRVDIPSSFSITHEIADRGVARNVLILIEKKMGYDGVSTIAYAKEFFKQVKGVDFGRKRLEGFQWMGSLARLLGGVGRTLLKHHGPILQIASDISREVAVRRHPNQKTQGYNCTSGPPSQCSGKQWMYKAPGKSNWTFSRAESFRSDEFSDERPGKRAKGMCAMDLPLSARAESEVGLATHLLDAIDPERCTSVISEDYNTTGSLKRSNGYNMMQGRSVRQTRGIRSAMQVIVEEPVEQELEDQVGTRPYLAMRRCITIREDGVAVPTRVYAATQPVPELLETRQSPTLVKIQGEMEVSVYIYGWKPPPNLQGQLTYSDLQILEDALWSRLLTYGYLFSAGKHSEVHIGHEEQNMDLSGTSCSFALEAMLLRLSDKYLYAGDSNPHLDFLPEFTCEPQTVKLKASTGQPTIFKCAWTSGAVEEFPVPIISEAMDMYPLPHQFIIESTTPLMYLQLMGRINMDETPKVKEIPKHSAPIIEESKTQLSEATLIKPKDQFVNPFLEEQQQQAQPTEVVKKSKSKKEKPPSKLQYPDAKKKLTELQQLNLTKLTVLPPRELLWLGPAKSLQSLEAHRDDVYKFATSIDMETVKGPIRQAVSNGLSGLKALVTGDLSLGTKQKSGLLELVTRYVPLDPNTTRVWSQEVSEFVPIAGLHPQVKPGLGKLYLTGQLKQIQRSLRGETVVPDTTLVLEPYAIKKVSKSSKPTEEWSSSAKAKEEQKHGREGQEQESETELEYVQEETVPFMY